MKRIAILVEGGGKGAGTKAVLRNGFNAFFRDISENARGKFSWKLQVCGSRGETYKAFHIEMADKSNTFVFLLVDSDGPVETGPLAYLSTKAGFRNLTGAEEHHLHLMVQTMEAWIMADGAAMAGYYGQHFGQNSLPKVKNLEAIAKADLESAFKKAIAHTSKPEYDKIHDAAALLARINPETVQSRCPSARRFFAEVTRAITPA